jgi:hypothetical protein
MECVAEIHEEPFANGCVSIQQTKVLKLQVFYESSMG